MRDRVAAARRRLLGERPATVDTASMPVITPLQPIDLNDERAFTKVVELAMNVGEVLLDSGTGAIDTSAQIAFVAASYGVTDCAVDVTYNAIHVSARRGPGLPPTNYMRTVKYRSLDYTRLQQADRVIRRIGRGYLSLDNARAALEAIVAADHPYSRKVALSGWALMAAAVTLMLGGSPTLAVVSFFTTAAIYGVNVTLGKLGLPYFFQQVMGGFLATVPAAVIYRLAVEHSAVVAPYRIIVSGIIVLMAGLSLVGSVQDAITGAPVTAAGRFIEVMVYTAGLVGGVGIALRLTSALGASLPPMQQEVFPYAPLPIMVLTGGLAAAAFALASYASPKALATSFASGAVGAGLVGVILDTGLGPIVASATAATVVGLAGGLLARRAVVPPIIVAVAGITPLVPGLAVYRGLSEIMAGQTLAAIANLFTAIMVGCTLAAGVTLGEWVARTMRRPRLPRRLLGPRVT
nr:MULTISPECIES: threonine/serine exporter family protein [unclassified Mycolicibacterium]